MMNRKLLAFLAAALLLTCLPLTALAANSTCGHWNLMNCVCQDCGDPWHSGVSSSNNNDHHTAYCSACSTFLANNEAHYDHDNDNICDFHFCSAVINPDLCSHVDKYGNDATMIRGHGPQGHVVYCHICRRTITPVAPHTDADNDGFCDEMNCGYCVDASKCIHKDIVGNPSTNFIRKGQGHIEHCHRCNTNIGTLQPHSEPDNNGRCSICGHFIDTSKCPHPDTYGNRLPNTDGHEELCVDCQSVIVPFASHYDNDNVLGCDKCSYVNPSSCPHANTDNDFDAYGHYTQCLDCYTMLATTPHEDLSVPCTGCAYVPCQQHIPGAGEWAHNCTVCWFRLSECVSNDGNCDCDICGMDNCHIGEPVFTATTHEFKCTRTGCNYEIVGKHQDPNNDDYCDTCGYAMKTVVNDSRYDSVPKTGDITVTVFAAALALMATALVLLKKFRTV